MHRDALPNWFFDCGAAQLAAVFEAMTAERPIVQWGPLESPPAGGLRWRQCFRAAGDQDIPGAAWVLAADADWTEAAKLLLQAVGMTDEDEATLKSTYREAIEQVLGGIARDLGASMNREVTCWAGEESTATAEPALWAQIHIQFKSGKVSLVLGGEKQLLDLLVTTQPPETPAVRESKTFDLLLDVELPVSVSFGRAQVPLKDVIKLTTGSIVELNRSIGEPVEVIVNNCVIARGEVVVVEGNFGVRIREVISRQERLRTLT